jgi:hypothetical protein
MLSFDCNGYRYVAIYKPLLYSVSMSPRVCVTLIIASYVGGILHAIIHTVATLSLSFWGSNEIRHLFCDIPPLLVISYSDTCINQLLPFCCVDFICDSHHLDCFNLLWFHSFGHSEYEFCWREAKSVLYLCSSPNWGVLLSQNNHLHVCKIKLQLCLGKWQNSLNIKLLWFPCLTPLYIVLGTKI